MHSHEPGRTARLEVRIAPEALAVVRRAAEIQGRSVSDFFGCRRTGSCQAHHHGDRDHSAVH